MKPMIRLLRQLQERQPPSASEGFAGRPPRKSKRGEPEHKENYVCIYIHTYIIYIDRERAGEINTETERQRDRETERQRDRETERQRDRETERQRDRETERQRDRETERQTDRQTDR